MYESPVRIATVGVRTEQQCKMIEKWTLVDQKLPARDEVKQGLDSSIFFKRGVEEGDRFNPQ